MSILKLCLTTQLSIINPKMATNASRAICSSMIEATSLRNTVSARYLGLRIISRSLKQRQSSFSTSSRLAATPASTYVRKPSPQTSRPPPAAASPPPASSTSSIDDQSPIQDLSSGLADEPIILDEGQRQVDWTRSFHGLSAQPFSKEAADVLLAPIPFDDVECKPDGIIYLPEIKYRRILNKAFGPGGWGLAPRGETIVTGKSITREYALVAHGRYVDLPTQSPSRRIIYFYKAA